MECTNFNHGICSLFPSESKCQYVSFVCFAPIFNENEARQFCGTFQRELINSSHVCPFLGCNKKCISEDEQCPYLKNNTNLNLEEALEKCQTLKNIK